MGEGDYGDFSYPRPLTGVCKMVADAVVFKNVSTEIE